jgi:hypothetical protein
MDGNNVKRVREAKMVGKPELASPLGAGPV